MKYFATNKAMTKDDNFSKLTWYHFILLIKFSAIAIFLSIRYLNIHLPFKKFLLNRATNTEKINYRANVIKLPNKIPGFSTLRGLIETTW